MKFALLLVVLLVAPNVGAIEVKESINPPPLRDRLVQIEKMMTVWGKDLKKVKDTSVSHGIRIQNNEVILSEKANGGVSSGGAVEKRKNKPYRYYR